MNDLNREEWECQVFDNLEAMSAKTPDAPGAEIVAPEMDVDCPRCTSDADLARALQQMPLLDEQACCSRLA